MLNRFIKKSSKFFAVLLTATLAFTPLSYAAPVTSFAEFQTALSDGTATIDVSNNITADGEDSLGSQIANNLTINGGTYSVSGNDSASGMEVKIGDQFEEKITAINDIEFKNFYKEDDGSAIYNKGGNITIKDSSFTANKSTVRGGAIYNKTKSDEQEEEHRYGSLTIQNSLFSGNEAFAMGAIMSEGVLTITDTVFENNKAEYMGVLGITGSKKDKTTLTNVTFSNNSSTNGDGAYPNAGVIYLGGEANILIEDSNFENNSSAAEGGAIGSAFLDLGDEDPDFTNAKLDVTGSAFKKNTAQTNGGAIDNYFYGSENEEGYVYVKDSTFEENKAQNGGAIYNHGNIDGNSVAQMIIDGATKFIKNIAGISATVTGNGGAVYNEGNLVINDGVEFSTNSASGKGGAIFNVSNNNEGGVIDFNGDAIFVDNYIGSEDNKNDIYNDGTLNFNGKADGAIVTMTGGILGSGTTNIGDAYNTNNKVSLKLDENAQLKQNAIVINQNSELEVNAANIEIVSDENPYIYNSGSLVLFTNSADAVSLANSIYDTTNTGTTIIKADANIDLGSKELQQYGLSIEEDATLTASANNLTISSEDGISNEGNLKLMSETDEQTNENNISGNGKVFIDGSLINEAEINQSSVTVGASIESMVINEGLIRSTDVVVNEGSTLVAKGEIDTYGDGEFVNGKITNNGTFVINVLNDEGEPDTVPNFNTIIGTGELRISSTNFVVQENAKIEQNSVVIQDKDSSLSVDVSSITVSPDGSVKNAGKFVLTGEGTNNNKVEGYDNVNGEIVFADGSEIENAASINQSTVTILGTVTNTANTNIVASEGVVINENGSLTTSATDINGQIENNKDLIFTSGINNNVIVGTGTLTINGVVINGNAESTTPMITISQSTVTISGADSQLYNVGEITTNYLTGEGELENQTKLILNMVEDSSYGLAKLTGSVGVSSITVESGKTVTLNNTGTIQQATIETYGDGTLVLTGNDIIANVVNYMTGNSLDIATRIVGSLDNNPGNEETQGIVNILDGGSVSGLITNSTGTVSIYTNFEVETGITSNNSSDISKNIINIGNAPTAGVVISSQTIEYQTINISSGSLTMKSGTVDGTIKDSSISVAADGLLSVNPEKLVNISNPITNDGIVEYYGGGEGLDYVLNTSTITASDKGILRINGNVQNDEQVGISKQDIEVLKTSTFTVNTNDMSDSKIKNAGEVLFFGLSDMTNVTEVTGLEDADTGEIVYGTLSVDTTLINNAKIDQTDININADVTNNEEMNARGIFTNSLYLDNTSEITAVTFRNEATGKLTNESDATITATTRLLNLNDINNAGLIEVTNDNGDALLNNAEGSTITNNDGGTISADVLTNGEDSSIENKEGALIEAVTLTNSGTIASSGTITVSDTLTNNNLIKSSGTITAGTILNNSTINSSGTITATNITNEAGAVIENCGQVSEDGEYTGGIITSENQIENKGTIISNASGMSAAIFNKGDGEVGNGVYNVLGGTVTYDVSGVDTEKSTVNIQGDVTIAEGSFISQNNINLEEGNTLTLKDESNLRTSVLNIGEGATLDIVNDETNDMTIEGINVGDGITWNFKFDVDLKAGTTDLLTNTNFASNSTMTVTMINVLQDSEKATTTYLTVADSYTYADILNTTFGTTQIIYKVAQDMNVSTATVLGITADGYGGLPNAVYDGLSLYLVTGESEEDPNEYLRKWITDEHGTHDELVADMSINGKNTVLVSSPIADPETGEIPTLTGLKTGSNTLRINDNEDAQGLTIKGFEDALTVNKADGVLEVNNVVFDANTGTAVIANEGTTVLNGVAFNDTNETTYDVLNNGNVVLENTLTTFNKGIVGEGTTTIKGIAIDMGDATVAQSTIEISHVAGSSLTVKVDKLQYEGDGGETIVTGLIINNNELVLAGNEEEDSILATEIKGFGNVELENNIVVENNISQNNVNLVGATVTLSEEKEATLKATTVSVDENSSLTANANNIDTFATNGGINNEGVITFVGGTNNNVITGEQGKIFIEMGKEVINSTGTKISQQFIEVKEDAKFAMNADDVQTSTTEELRGIQNNGDLEITGGTNSNIIGRGDGAEGNLIISGNVINKEDTEIDQETITVNEDASFKAKANDLITDNGIANAGELVLLGGEEVENNNTITGTGNLTIDGNLINTNSITQTNIDIISGTFEHNVGEDEENPAKISATNIFVSTSASLITHSEIVASDKITNNGIFEFNVDSEGTSVGDEAIKNTSEIVGTGEMKITATTFATENNIKQSTITIDSESTFRADVNKVIAEEQIKNEGLVTLEGEGVNKNVITGAGNLTIDGTVENSTGTAISQSAIAVTEGNSFKASADDITTEIGIENDGTLTFTGGTNNNEITMLEDAQEAVLNIEKDLINKANITQKEINIQGGDFENVRTSSVTAEKITVADGSTLVTDAKDLDISDSITITGSKTVLNLKDEGEAEISAQITGAGKIVKEGEGTVTLSGENGYTGTTTITGGAIRIVAAEGISEEKVYMDGGKLITGANSEITLSNEILGTDHNDVNIETEEGGNLILNGKILGNKDLVKTGAGLLDLQMTSNSYAGDTLINEGAVRGTTANINGKVIGSGDENSGVEFYDADGEVTLNEIDTTKFIGTFDKTGAATMTVSENFKAANANILSGTFIINNDTEMGGSGNTFEVTDTMRVESALLKGYGNITTGELIIGEGATFAPGNSTTTFKVAGNLTFEQDGEYDVEFGQFDMDEEGHYNDNTNVSGTTTIGDNAKITLNNLEGKYYVWETIDLINSGTLADGYEYQEDNVVFNDNDARDLRPGYDTRISTRVYTEGNALKIELQRKQSEYSDAIEFERSHNEQEAANAIDAISTGNGGDITNPLDAMEKMYYYQETYDIEGLQAALNDIAGVIHANSTMLTFTNAKIEHVYDKIKERTKDILPCTKFHDKVWAEYYYNTYQVDKNENSPKFDTSVNGFLVGFDMISAKQWTMGVMAGYGTSELKQEQDKTTMNDINLGFYGGFENEKWLLKGMLLGGYEQYNTDRTIAFMERMAHSEYNGYSAALDLEAGYKISLNKKDSQAKHKMYLKPFLGVTGSYINNEGFEEKNAESLNLKVNDYSNFAAQARAGVGINGKVKKFGWYAKAGVRQFLTEDYNEIESSLLDYQDQTKMKIRSAELDKFSYGGGLGADFALSDAWTIFANGLASFADKSNNYYGNIGLMYKFGCVNNEKKTDEDVEKITAMLNDKMTEEELLKKQLEDKEKELNDAKKKEKELQDRIQKYEANIVSEEEAQKMKEKTIKTMRLGEKPTFVFGTDKLNGSGKESLKQVARELESYPDAEVLVEGHTDNVGGDEINQKISENRASTVATALKKDYGVKNNISAIGKGKTEPIASNDTAEGRAKNRRVEIIVTTNE